MEISFGNDEDIEVTHEDCMNGELVYIQEVVQEDLFELCCTQAEEVQAAHPFTIK